MHIPTQQAATWAQQHYGITGTLTPLPGELDLNFRIDTPAHTYLLKISRPDADADYLDFQQAILQHVAQRNTDITSPHVLPDNNGHYRSTVQDAAGHTRHIRLLTWVPGRLWSSVHPVSDDLLHSLGQQAGQITQALQGFDHPAAHRHMDWDLARAEWTTAHLSLFPPSHRETVRYFQTLYQAFPPRYHQLRKSVIHNDANDNNIIVTEQLLTPHVRAIIDYGDAIHTNTIHDLATAIAYAVMHKPDALAAAIPLVAGYHSTFPLQTDELPFLYTLVAMRLVISVTKSAINRQKEPDNEYLLISEKAAWEVLDNWQRINPDFAHYRFRQACGYNPHPQQAAFAQWAKTTPISLADLFPTIAREAVHLLDLSVASQWIGHQTEFNDLELFQFKIERLQRQVPDRLIAGGYLEPRPIYTSTAYDRQGNNGPESRTIHLGIDFWLPAQTPVHALFDGVIVTAVNDAGDKEYGGLIILKHHLGELTFFTLHGHLSLASVADKTVGQPINKGDCLGYLGNYPENGNWAPHLHFQIMLSMLSYTLDFPGVAYASEIATWKSICPDPNLLFNNDQLHTRQPTDAATLITYRQQHLGKSLSLSYPQPLHIVRGAGAYLLDSQGRKYLDTVNNVAHVGHEHPRVVRAGQQQMALLNTNTRYLHENITDFAQALLATFPPQLSVVHFVNSGSEATELALRMARTGTQQQDMIAVEVGYHGNTGGCIDISSYKFAGKGGKGRPPHTHIVPLPDAYRGLYQGTDTGPSYAAHIQQQIEMIEASGRQIAGFICESLLSCGGQIELPDHYLQTAYAAVRKAGGLCIADEVQVGCGRLGHTFWGFQLHGVIPDIVTIGKPLGNGHPLAAVVCTRAVAEAFANGMEYFNTFGGNPVSCAIGHEVLRVIEHEKLQENALLVGNHLLTELRHLQQHVPFIGQVRGQGLFLGIELADTLKNPLPTHAAYLVNRMKEHGILLSTDGKDNNVLKIKPPLVFSLPHADQFLTTLKRIFTEDFLKS